MEIFKNSRGHFFGILIPGLFLTINIYFFYPEILNEFGIKPNFDLSGNNTLGILLLFVFSYVFGIGLRLLKPTWLEKIAFLLRLPLIVLDTLWQRFILKNPKYRKCFNNQLLYYSKEFPYRDWFFTYYIKHSSKTYRGFYNDILKKEFNNKYESINKHFINYCKNFIYENSNGLGEEVMYNEGLTRFLSGVLYAILISIITIVIFTNTYQNILVFYILIFIFFLFKLKRIRIKEVLSIYDGYMILNKK